ncbi:MAG TPA: LLM class flavin-dependent oxidoreductase [Candidatus Binataceae bacterium]|nr:LLM class flavin-dependent oxidoreductase [Candidatus Binataceae bacterium]
MPNLGLSVPVLQTSTHKLAELARLADYAGFRSLWNYEAYRNPFVMHAVAASATKRIQLGTGIAEAFIRSPFATANAAADVDELSGGRTILGIGPGGPDWLEAFHSTDASDALSRMSEYVDVVRMTWDYFSGGARPELSYAGKYYRFNAPPVNPWGPRQLARPRIPVYLSAMRPRMLQLAGEKADGTLGYLHTPEFARDHVKPNLAKGARRTGRDPMNVDYASLIVCSVAKDRAQAVHRARIQVGIYVAVSVSDVIVHFHGCQAEQAAIRAAIAQGGVEAIEAATSDKLVELFAIAGTPDEARKQAIRYRESIPHVILHPPYAPLIPADATEDSFRNIVATFGD